MGIKNKLTNLMKCNHTNANELSRMSGVPATTIYSLIARDSNRVDIDSLIKIAHALGVTADYFSDTDETMAAHFDGNEYTEDELNKIREFAEFVRSNRNK